MSEQDANNDIDSELVALTKSGDVSTNTMPAWLLKSVSRLKFPVHLDCKIDGSYDDSSKMGFLEAILPGDSQVLPSITYRPMYQETELKYSAGDCYPFMPLSVFFFEGMKSIQQIETKMSNINKNLQEIIDPIIYSDHAINELHISRVPTSRIRALLGESVTLSNVGKPADIKELQTRVWDNLSKSIYSDEFYKKSRFSDIMNKSTTNNEFYLYSHIIPLTCLTQTNIVAPDANKYHSIKMANIFVVDISLVKRDNKFNYCYSVKFYGNPDYIKFFEESKNEEDINIFNLEKLLVGFIPNQLKRYNEFNDNKDELNLKSFENGTVSYQNVKEGSETIANIVTSLMKETNNWEKSFKTEGGTEGGTDGKTLGNFFHASLQDTGYIESDDLPDVKVCNIKDNKTPEEFIKLNIEFALNGNRVPDEYKHVSKAIVNYIWKDYIR